MPEGTIGLILRHENISGNDIANNYFESITDGFTSSKLEGDEFIEYSGATFLDDIDGEVEKLLVKDNLDKLIFFRIIFNDEYGNEKFWVFDNGVLTKYSHSEDDDVSDLVEAYKDYHRNIGSIERGALEKKLVLGSRKKRKPGAKSLAISDIEGKWLIIKTDDEDYRDKNYVWEFENDCLIINDNGSRSQSMPCKKSGRKFNVSAISFKIIGFEGDYLKLDYNDIIYTCEKI
jgi:hypothetical protein